MQITEETPGQKATSVLLRKNTARHVARAAKAYGKSEGWVIRQIVQKWALGHVFEPTPATPVGEPVFTYDARNMRRGPIVGVPTHGRINPE